MCGTGTDRLAQMIASSFLNRPRSLLRLCQVWHQQSDGAEAADAGERARGRLLRHLRICRGPNNRDSRRSVRVVFATQVSAYTSTKLGERKAEDKKLANPELFFWQRVDL